MTHNPNPEPRAARTALGAADAEPTCGRDAVMVARAELVLIVSSHEPADAREVDAKERFLVELERLERPCDQRADPVHVTASAVVVGVRGTVLHRHRLLGRWLQPGGHIEAGESPPEAARREAQHPCGDPLLLRLDVHRAGEALGHTHLDLCYLLTGPDDDPTPEAGESPDASWWGWDDARDVADGSLRAALDAARSRWTELSVSGTGRGGAR